MRHRQHGSKLGRTSAHRKALFRNQLTALFSHERITTTLTKAKALRPIAERMVTLARTGSVPARRKVLTMVPSKEVVRRLFDEIAPRFVDRPGGYLRILRSGRRHGDGAEMAVIEFIDFELEQGEGSGKEKKKSFMDRAKGVFGGSSAAPEAASAEAEQETDEPAEQQAAAEQAEPEQDESAADDEASAAAVSEEAEAPAQAEDDDEDKDKPTE